VGERRFPAGVLFTARRILMLSGALAAFAIPAPAMAASCPGASSGPADPAAVQATLCLLNEQRSAHRLPALTDSGSLDRAAGDHAADMVARRFFDHVSPGGGTMLQRIKAAGWIAASGSWTAGENIAWGSGSRGTPAAIVDSWMRSAGHRANILNRAFVEVGIGIASGAPRTGSSGSAGTYVTDFGSRGAATAASTKSGTRRRPIARCASKSSVRAKASRRTARRCAPLR
jgi:uncharacterized protein YkwD